MSIGRIAMRRGSSEPLIRAMEEAAIYARQHDATVAIHYHFDPDPARRSGFLTMEVHDNAPSDVYDTLVMTVAPDTIPEKYPAVDTIREARQTILRLYRRIYYRRYGVEQRTNPDLAPAWRARRNEYNRRYRRRQAGLEETDT